MMGFDAALSDFLNALFTFLNELLNGIFGTLASFFGGFHFNLP